MEILIISDSEQQTQKIAGIFSRSLEIGHVILLSGELGAGKTTFVSGIARSLGIKEDISSPSFTILNVYNISKSRSLVHADFYRLSSASEAANTGIDDYLYGKGFITFIEWPDILKMEIKKDYLEINFNYIIDDYSKRQIQIKSHSRYWDKKLKPLKDILKKCII